MRAVFLDMDTVDNGDLDRSALFEVLEDWTFYAQTDADKLLEHIGNADILITNKVSLKDEWILSNAPCLKLICVAATGTDNVNLEGAHRLGIRVCNVRNYCTTSVAEHTIALMLSLIRHIPQYGNAVKQGQWAEADSFSLKNFFSINELNGLILGIIGYGVLGSAVSRMAKNLGMHIVIAEQRGRKPRANRETFESVLEQADILSLHCPLTPETAGMIDSPEINLLGPRAILINTARGELINSQSLAIALRERRLGGAGIDVLETEPPPANHPLLSDNIPNLIVTPHIAWASHAARQRLIDEIALNIHAFQKGNPRNQVA